MHGERQILRGMSSDVKDRTMKRSGSYYMMTDESRVSTIADDVQNRPIRELVELYPETMQVLSGYGIDVCCGGSHTVAEAAEAHGHQSKSVVFEVIKAISRKER